MGKIIHPNWKKKSNKNTNLKLVENGVEKTLYDETDPNNHKIHDGLLDQDVDGSAGLTDLTQWWKQAIESFVDMMSLDIPEPLRDNKKGDDLKQYNLDCLNTAFAEIKIKRGTNDKDK